MAIQDVNWDFKSDRFFANHRRCCTAVLLKTLGFGCWSMVWCWSILCCPFLRIPCDLSCWHLAWLVRGPVRCSLWRISESTWWIVQQNCPIFSVYPCVSPVLCCICWNLAVPFCSDCSLFFQGLNAWLNANSQHFLSLMCTYTDRCNMSTPWGVRVMCCSDELIWLKLLVHLVAGNCMAMAHSIFTDIFTKILIKTGDE